MKFRFSIPLLLRMHDVRIRGPPANRVAPAKQRGISLQLL